MTISNTLKMVFNTDERDILSQSGAHWQKKRKLLSTNWAIIISIISEPHASVALSKADNRPSFIYFDFINKIRFFCSFFLFLFFYTFTERFHKQLQWTWKSKRVYISNIIIIERKKKELNIRFKSENNNLYNKSHV